MGYIKQNKGKKKDISKIIEGPQNIYLGNPSPSQPRFRGFVKKNMKLSHPKVKAKQVNSVSRKSSSVRNNRGKKYTNNDHDQATKKYFSNIRKVGVLTSNYVTSGNNYAYPGPNTNNMGSYYPKNARINPRSRTNSRKRGTIAPKLKDSRNNPQSTGPPAVRQNRNSIKKTTPNYGISQGRPKPGNNRSNLKERIKTIEYADSNFKNLVGRSNTVQRRRKLQAQNNLSAQDNYAKPYSNIGPSMNTRSNITIDRTASLGNKKNISGASNHSTIANYTNTKNSKKAFLTNNEYEDESLITANSYNYGKNPNHSAIIGVKNNIDPSLTSNNFKNNKNSKEINQKPKFNKVVRKEFRSKSNKRVNRGIFERVYMQSPHKLFKNGHSHIKLRRNISNNDSQGSLLGKKFNRRDNTVSPTMPRVNGVPVNPDRNHTTIKERPPQKFNNSMKHEVSSINTSKDQSRLNFPIAKHASEHELETHVAKDYSIHQSSAIVENCSSVTTIKRSKVHENMKQKGSKRAKVAQPKKKVKTNVPDSFYSTQKHMKKNTDNNISFFESRGRDSKYKKEALLKYKKKSKEEIKRSNHFKEKGANSFTKEASNIFNRKATLEKLKDGSSVGKSSQENPKGARQLKKKNKMSEDTYIESKSSLANVIKKKRTSLITKKWRKEVKKQIQNENLFKRSKEKKLDFSINESPLQNKKEMKGSQKLRHSVNQLRNEIIQDDSEDEEYTISRKESDNSSILHKGDFKLDGNGSDGNSSDSNPLQKIIEQRMLESSTDSEESEEELDDDYDIGIDDIDIGQEETNEIYTATEDEESNILSESLNTRIDDSANYHKKKLKEALSKGKEISPFEDLIEKGLKNYMNTGFRKEVKLKEGIKPKGKLTKQNLKSYDNRKKRPESKKKTRESLGLSQGFDSSPIEKNSHRKEKRGEKGLEEVRRDQIDLQVKNPFS